MHAQIVYKHSLLSCLLAFHFHVLEREMATDSSVLAWRTQGRGSLVGCRLWGCRVGHDCSDLAAAAADRALDLLWADMLFLRDLKLPDI